MKIVLHVDSRPSDYTGIGRYMVELARALKRRGNDLKAWSNISWFEDSTRLFSGMDIPVYPIVTRENFNDSLLPRLYSALGKHGIIHCPNGNLVNISDRIPQTVMIHDLSVFLLDDIKPKDEILCWREKIEHCVRKASGIMVNSISTANDLVRIFPEAKKKMFLTELGIDHLGVSSGRKQEEKKHILAVGTIEPRKNYIALLKAYRTLSSSWKDIPPLVIAGGQGFKAGQIIAESTKLGISEKVTFLGYVDEEELCKLYLDAYCLVHPAVHEGFGLTIPEALGLGVPVVCSKAGSMENLYAEATYMIDPHDIESIANGMVDAIENGFTPDQEEKTTELFNKYTWDKCALQTEKAFQTILG